MTTPPPGQESARDLTKLLISLASGVIAVSATFATKVSGQPFYVLVVLGLAWIALAGSIYFGVQVLSKVVDVQSKSTEAWMAIILPPMRWCWRFFEAGVALLMIYGVLAGWVETKTPVDKPAPAACECKAGAPSTPVPHGTSGSATLNK